MSTNKKKSSNQKWDLNQEKLGSVENKKNYESEAIESGEENVGEEKPKDDDEIFKNIHTEPADEQQFENNTLGSNTTK